MILNHSSIINKLTNDLIEYLLNERELEDYIRHCEENNLDDSNFLQNACLPGAHVYAKAYALAFHLEQKEQKIEENRKA